MAVVWCPGGHTFPDKEVPSPHKYWLISDEQREQIDEVIADEYKEGKTIDLATFTLALIDRSVTLYKCPICGRLLVFHLDGTKEVYLPELGPFREVPDSD